MLQWVFWNPGVHPQWHTFFNKARAPNPSQGVLPSGDQNPNKFSYGANSHPNHCLPLPGSHKFVGIS